MVTSRLVGALAVVMAVATACAPATVGPELPRPPQTAASPPTTMAPSSTTTTLDSKAVVAGECPGAVCLVYRISADARWSDGSAVTSADFVATVAAQQDPLVTTPEPGYDHIESVDVLDQKTVRVVLGEPYGAWEGLFSRVIPAHDGSTKVTDLASTGPFVLDRWIPGDRIVVSRNDQWWADADPISGDPVGPVSQIDFVFMADADEMLSSLEEGDIDVMVARPDVDMVDRLAGAAAVDYTLAPGPFWEHIDFHHDDEMLSRDWVREVFDLAIDRQKILDETVRRLDPGIAALDNTIWMSNTSEYESHYADRLDPAAAEKMLIDHGCSRDGRVYVCGGQEMSFVWASTNDDPDRREILASVTEDLAAVGIELSPDLRAPSGFVNRDFLFGGPDRWQLVNFSWRAGSDPAGAEATYRCDDTELNVNRFCSADVEAAIRAASVEMDPVARAALYNEADRVYLEERALIPLYQKPTLMAWSRALNGPVPNYSSSSDLWNVASWTGKRSIVVALPAEPPTLNVLSTADDNANVVLSTLLYGAFGMDPMHQHIPVLIESVEVVPGG